MTNTCKVNLNVTNEQILKSLKSVDEAIYVQDGVGSHQGSPLSSFLLVMVMDRLADEFRQESSWTMMFADGIVICSESREEVEESRGREKNTCERMRGRWVGK